MKATRALLAAAVATTFATPALADYETNPELLPDRRCVTDEGLRFDVHSTDPETGETPSGLDPIHCQPLFWDIPAAPRVGYRAAAAVYEADPIPQWPRGLTDRLPPLFVYDPDGDGIGNDCPADDDYYGQFFFCGDGVPDGFETAGPFGDRTELCEDPDQIPWWQPIWADPDGNEVTGKKGKPFLGYGEGAWAEGGVAGQREGHIHEVACRRGSRTTIGPWQVGTDPSHFDAKATQKRTRFENTARLDRDADRGMFPDGLRWEWNDGTEFYNHFSAHHGVCYDINHECNGKQPREAAQPGGACWDYHKSANSPEEKAATDPNGEDPANGGCHSNNQYADRCDGRVGGNGAFRNATQIPGRLYVEMPGGRGLPSYEDQLWSCDHHVVHQLPPGSYGMTKLADYRQQKGGVRNDRAEGDLYGAAPGTVVGGAVGEMVIQYFTLDVTEDVRPINIMFNVLGDAVTTYYPPFTYHYHTSLWTPPFDAEIGLFTIHSHHRMVKGTMDILPQNPPRLNSPNPLCGGSLNEPAANMYVGWEWEDAYPCEYWKEPDGPLTIRKGEMLATSCYVNNGVTPEAIKHGLVAGSTVEALKLMGAPIPDYPELVPASSWGDALADSPVGDQLLYGTHPPINYRVVYKCSTIGPNDLYGSTLVAGPTGIGYKVCDPNPAVDADGDYIDGPYINEAQCGEGGWCQPGSIVFACIGEDEMCIGVALYWAMDRLGNEETQDAAMENITSADPDRVRRTGTPGNLGINPDVAGICPECDEGPGL